jgi:AcrR family transcriptional regulator
MESTTLGAVLQRPAAEQLLGPLYEQLVPRRNASSKAVRAHQRARLHAAMIEACVEHGYAASTARELATLAGVSTKALYKHFGSKEECFLATYDLVVQQAVGRISDAYRAAPDGRRDWAAGLCRAFEAFSTELIERPGPSRLALVDVLAGGADTLERIERVEATFNWMIRQGLAQAPDGAAVPPTLIRPLIGGVWFVSRSRLLEGRPEALATCGAELLEWMLSYRSSLGVPLVGFPSTRTRRDPRAERPVDDEFLGARALARALRESEGAATWPESVFRAVQSLFCQVAEDRTVARVAFVGAFAAGATGIDRRTALMRGFADFLARRAPSARRPSPLVAEAIVGSIWSMAHRQVAKDQAHQLPALSARAAFLALAPIVGAEVAMAAVSAGSGAPTAGSS